MSSEYRNNHFVPVWYQKRFIPSGTKDQVVYLMDLHPGAFKDGGGMGHFYNAVRRKGPKQCFCEYDLYTTTFGSSQSTDIEEHFFGSIDTNGKAGVEYFSNYQFQKGASDAFQNLMVYMSTQKLRTPKGLGWLKEQVDANSHNRLLHEMVRLRNLFCAVWTESVWSIVDASLSPQRCRGFNDPEIWMNGSHTIFPLSFEKLLILTNLSWVRNPYQSPTKFRPYPNPQRDAVMQFLQIQTARQLSEQEVREINFIIKSRAYKYVAAGSEDWLYPEQHVSKSNWPRYGHGYLLMPDPRGVPFTTELLFGFNDGRAMGYDQYGRQPWHPDYRKQPEGPSEWHTFNRFKGEFARLFGPYRRGRTYEFGRLEKERDSDELHRAHLNYEKQRPR